MTLLYLQNDQPTKWRIENSWGESSCEKGYICMTNDWFKEFVFEIVVPEAALPIVQELSMFLPHNF